MASGADGVGERSRSAVIMRYGCDTSWSQRAAEVSGFRQVLEEAARRGQREQDAGSPTEGQQKVTVYDLQRCGGAGLANPPANPFQEAVHGWLLGSQPFIDRIRRLMKEPKHPD